MVKEKDAFESEDFREMTARLEYLKEIRSDSIKIVQSKDAMYT